MFLSNLELNTKNTKVSNWMRNPYRIHQRLWMGFESSKKESTKPEFIFRVEDNFLEDGIPKPRILVLSYTTPSWVDAFQETGFLLNQPKIINLNIDSFIQKDKSFRFSLKANPSRKKKDFQGYFKEKLEDLAEGKKETKLKSLIDSLSKEEWKRVPSKRVGIYSDLEQIKWIESKGKGSGFVLENLYFDKGEFVSGINKRDSENSKNINYFIVQFSGILRVVDADAFKHAFQHGIGSGKAFGCGMLMIGRI